MSRPCTIPLAFDGSPLIDDPFAADPEELADDETPWPFPSPRQPQDLFGARCWRNRELLNKIHDEYSAETGRDPLLADLILELEGCLAFNRGLLQRENLT
jgi:hypothetical protein